MEHKLFIDGQWVDGGSLIEVTNKYTGAVIGAVPSARREEVDAALAAAERAAQTMADLPAHRRSEILAKVAAKIRERGEELARTIAAEAGKALKIERSPREIKSSTTRSTATSRRLSARLTTLPRAPTALMRTLPP